jgi:hypothetical protein
VTVEFVSVTVPAGTQSAPPSTPAFWLKVEPVTATVSLPAPTAGFAKTAPPPSPSWVAWLDVTPMDEVRLGSRLTTQCPFQGSRAGRCCAWSRDGMFWVQQACFDA